jgi:ABC-type antimicrobial peptide transport system, ATPase component
MSLIQFNNLQFNYPNSFDFLFKMSQFSISKGSRIFIEGPSGSGKTTFLNLMTGLVQPTSGSITVLEKDITRSSMSDIDRFRADHFGIIFQWFNLLPYLSVLENIELPCFFSTIRKQNVLNQFNTVTQSARYLCDNLDIDDQLLSKPVSQLSIGQQQRVAIARALIGQPEIIIAE